MDEQFVLSFSTTASDLLAAEAQQLAHMTSFPDIATDMTVRLAFILSIPTQDARGGA